LQELYDRYPRLKAIPFSDRIRPVTVSYDSIFRNLLAGWDSGSQQIGERAEELKNRPLEKLVGWLKGASKEADNFPGRTRRT
jgi:hypothetical protein